VEIIWLILERIARLIQLELLGAEFSQMKLPVKLVKRIDTWATTIVSKCQQILKSIIVCTIVQVVLAQNVLQGMFWIPENVPRQMLKIARPTLVSMLVPLARQITV